MINTYNESSLHKSIKTLYAQDYNGQTEVERFGHIYDIVTETSVIEIQTGNLSKLLPKILDTLDHGLKVKIVWPLVESKWIESRNENDEILSCRKSPVRQSIYNLFDEITGLYPVLLHPDFSLDVIRVTTIEKRTRYTDPVQTPNKSRRFRKNYLKTGKELKEIISVQTFSKAEDYINLIPFSLEEEFCAKDLTGKLRSDKALPSSASKKAHITMWVLRKMELLEETSVKNRSHYYKIKTNG